MASNKNISLRIEDFVHASEYFNISDADANTAEGESNTAVFRDLFGNNSSSIAPILKLEDEMVSKQVTSYLRVEIIDNGAGIALENQPRVFNEFAQFNRNTLQGGGGSGLGLWICRNLATLHGGEMHFHSDGEGLGSTFFVELPVYKKMNDPEVVTAAEAIIPGHVESPTVPVGLSVSPLDEKKDDDDIETGSPKTKKLRVLIVDDSAAN
eukprot:gene26826-35517_t